MSAPKWASDHNALANLAEWMWKSKDLEHLDTEERFDEILLMLSKPQNFETEYGLMTHTKYRCADCGSNEDVETETQAERAEAGDPLYCADCDETRRAEARAPLDWREAR